MLRLFIMTLIAVLLSACSTSPSTSFYVLTPNSLAQNNQVEGLSAAPDNVGVSLGVGPVVVPDFLMRSQIAYSMQGNHLTVSESDRWSEPLYKAIARVIAINLSRLDPRQVTVVFPWRRLNKPRFSVQITVVNLNRVSADQAVLEADWALVDVKSRKIHHRASFLKTASVSDMSNRALAESYSDLLAVLSDSINTQVQSYVFDSAGKLVTD